MLFHKPKPSLPEAYEIYASNPSAESQDRFLRACFSYDFRKYKSDMDEIRKIYGSCGHSETSKRAFVFSNGSSGGECGYHVGPNGFELIRKVESFQRGVGTDKMLRVSTFHPEKRGFNKVVDGNYIVVDFASEGCVEFMEGFLKKNPHKRLVEATPNVFMMMACHDRLLDALKTRGVAVVTTGDDAYKTERMSSRDRMIDWKTGCNFYECPYGSKHILPVWFEDRGISHNILNLEKSLRSPVADLIDVEDFSDCRCGRKKCKIRLVSHFRHKPKSDMGYFDHNEIFGNLKGRYLNFQVIFRGGVAELLVDEFRRNESSKEEFEEDYELARTVLGSIGFATVLERGKYAYLGRRKRPLVWVDDGQIVREQF